MEWVTLSYTKWPDRPHYRYRMRVLGEDDHGVWGSCDAGEPVHKDGEVDFVRETALLALVPRPPCCWLPLWYPPAESGLEVYVNINTVPVRQGDTLTMVDLDLDVLRRRDGTVLLVDEDEFAENALRYRYPSEIVGLAERTAGDVRALVERSAEPFATAWRSWHEICFPA